MVGSRSWGVHSYHHRIQPAMKQLAVEFFSKVNRNSIGHLLGYLGKLPAQDCDLLLLIGSSGGVNEWARSAFSALANLPEHVHLTTCGCGTVDSAAVTFFCAGQRRICLPHTRFQLHQATWKINELVDLRRAQEIADILRSDDTLHATVISAAIGCPFEDVHNLIQQGVVWDAEEAQRRGLVQEVTADKPHLLAGRTVERIYNVED